MGRFHKASKAQAKLRAAFFGPSGSGKTFSALRVARGLGGRIAVIDTERGSASKYADRFEFDVLDLERKAIDDYVAAINDAASEGYDVLVIDSLSHAWQELLDQVEKLAQAKYRGNTWSAWSEGTPKQRRLVDAILTFPGHIIATMRSKTEWQTSDDGKGKSRPVRVGLAPEQGKGIEYEFDLLLEINTDHSAMVIKDRTGKFQDAMIDRPGEDFGGQLASWLSEGDARPADTSTPFDAGTAPAKGFDGRSYAQLVADGAAAFGLTDLTEVHSELISEAVAAGIVRDPGGNTPLDRLILIMENAYAGNRKAIRDIVKTTLEVMRDAAPVS